MSDERELAPNIVTGYTCDFCGKRFNDDAVLIGSVKCPNCGNEIKLTLLAEGGCDD